METASFDVASHVQRPGMAAPGPSHVSPLPPDFITWLSFKQACGTLVSLAVTGLLLSVAFLPFVALLAAGVWAAGTFLHEIAGLGTRFSAGDFPAVYRSLTVLDVAGRTGFFSASYFTLLLSLVVLITGMLGRRLQHLFLIPGVVLTVLSASGFIVATQFLLASLHVALLASDTSRRVLVTYVAVDAVVLAALLADLGPSRRARRRRARERLLALGREATAPSPGGVGAASAIAPLPAVTAPGAPAEGAESATVPAPHEPQVDQAPDSESMPLAVVEAPRVEAPADAAPPNEEIPADAAPLIAQAG